MYVDTSVRPQGELIDAVAPAKLKLSQAIRIGAKIRPQCRGEFFANGGSCALGAAVEAITGKADANFPGPWEVFFNAPDQIFGALLVRNDDGQSRESIADWLEAQGL